MKRILVVEDDPALLKGLLASLKEDHYDILSSRDGEEGYRKAKTENLDLIILDLMLPGKNGQDICRDLRGDGIGTPILMLTSRKGETDKVLGLELGADDYVTKPFSVQELKARIKALLRRQGGLKKDLEEFSFSDIHVDFKKQEAVRGKKKLDLSTKEFQILKYLAQREGEVVGRDMLLTDVWKYEDLPTTRTVDNFILTLRKKLEIDPAKPKYLLTVHGSGYKFVKGK